MTTTADVIAGRAQFAVECADAPLTVGSLFAGIGGFDLAFGRQGFHTAQAVEIDPNARRVLTARFPGATLHEDVQECGKHNLPGVDVVCGGFPCQDLSVAGKRAGLGGKRSGLFHEMVRITHELRPRYLVWENVPGLLSADSGRDFARVLRALADIGYFGAWRVLDARYFGVPQRRRRVFGVFARGRAGALRAAEILALSQGSGGHPAAGLKAGAGSARGAEGSASLTGGGADSPQSERIWNEGGASPALDTGRAIPQVFQATGAGAERAGAPSLSAGDDNGSNQDGQMIHAGMTIRRLTPVECCRLQGFPDDWLDLEPSLTDSAKYRLLGNAVAVPVVEWIARRILESLHDHNA